MEKEVIGKVLLTTKLGQKECFKIKYHFEYYYPLNPEVEAYEYVCSEGIMKREFFTKGIAFVDYTGHVEGYFNTVDVYEIEKLTKP